MRSPIEQYVIDRVREIRIEKNISQASLAYDIGFKSSSYIGEIESTKTGNNECYNISHLNEIAKVLSCSPKDFLPEKPI